MNWREIPIFSTIVVLGAAMTMIALGFWQLNRADEKNALLAYYKAAPIDTETMPYPEGEDAIEQALYRRVTAQCANVEAVLGKAGTNRVGVKGWAQVAQCTLATGQKADVALGWSRRPEPPEYAGGPVSGILAPGGRIVADPPLADLGPLAAPDPADLPNNHLAYAGQWFFFALTALVIYFLALRKKLGRPD